MASSLLQPAINSADSPPIASLSKPQQPLVETLSPWMLAFRRFSRNQLAIIGAFVVLFYVGVAIGADSLAPYAIDDYGWYDIRALPSRAHLLGTDDLGRDNLTLLMYGSRVSIVIGTLVPLMIIVIGVGVGVLAGYLGGRLDTLLMRFTDVVFAFPALLFLLLLVSVFGRSLWLIVFALGISGWPRMARVARGEFLRIKKSEYYLGAVAVGARPLDLIFQHVIPNMVGPVAVTATMAIPEAIISESMLTFLGLGVDATMPSWAILIDRGRDSIFWHPLLVLFPAAAISSLTLAFTFVGDGLRDALDPRLSERR